MILAEIAINLEHRRFANFRDQLNFVARRLKHEVEKLGSRDHKVTFSGIKDKHAMYVVYKEGGRLESGDRKESFAKRR